MRASGAVLAAAWLWPAVAAALSTNIGGDAAQFLAVGPGGRGLGMGDALGPVVEGPESMYWNPAGMAAAERPELAYSHAELLQYFRHDYLAYVQPVGALGGTLGAALTLWTMDALDAKTASDVFAGRFSPHSEAFALGYARGFWKGDDAPSRDREFFQGTEGLPFTPRPMPEDEDALWEGSMRAGAALKVVTESLRSRSATALALDAGAQYSPFPLPRLTLSFALRNLGSHPVFVAEPQSLPAEIDLGAAYDFRWEGRRLLPVVEFAAPYYGDPYAKVGCEYAVAAGASAELFFRAGYVTASAPYLGAASGPTAGVGLRVKRLRADVGFEPMAELGNALRLSLGYRF